MKQIAERDGVSKQAVQQIVRRLVEGGALVGVRKDTAGRITGVNVAEYDSARGTETNAAKLQAAQTARQLRSVPPVVPTTAAAEPRAPTEFTQAQTQRAHYDAELKKLELAERLGALLPRDAAIDAMRQIVDAISRQLDQLLLLDEQLMAAARDGKPALRAALKCAVFEVKRAGAASVRELEAKGRAAAAAGPIEVEIAAEPAAAP